MTSQAGRRSASPTAVVPFLAALMCVFGALVVLLVVVVEQARSSSAQVAKLASSRSEVATDDQRQMAEDLAWQADALHQAHQATQGELAQDQAQLAHLEEHIKRLKEEMRDLVRRQQERTAEGAASAELDALKGQLDETYARLAKARQDVAEAEQGIKNRQKSYAIIPFAGNQGTTRRPIYIECRGDRVILQPEGIELVAEDFEPPLGPGNPLAAALRATADYWAGLRDDKTGRPYPLMLVRPDGAVAYAACRSAMNAWQAEFGYELVAADMKLSFPPPDPALKQQVETILADARRRHEVHRSMAQRSGGAAAELRPSRHGGFETSGGQRGPRRTGSGPGGNSLAQGAGGSRPGSGFANGPGFADDRSAPDGQGGPGGLGNYPPVTGSAIGRPGFGGPGTGVVGNGLPGERLSQDVNDGGSGWSGSDRGSSQGTGRGTGNGLTEIGSAGPGSAGPGSAGTGGAGHGGAGPGPQGPPDRVVQGPAASGRPGGGVGSPSAGARVGGPEGRIGQASAGAGVSGGPGGPAGGPAGGSAGGSAGGPSGGSARESAGGSAGGSVGGSADMMDPQAGQVSVNVGGQATPESGRGQATGHRGPARSLAESRGANWAVPESATGSVGLRRPIRVRVTAQELVLLAEPGSRQTHQVFPIGDHPNGAIDPLVKAVHQRMRTWGIAGVGAYWVPQMILTVEADGQWQANQLEGLLQDSGVEVSRAKP